MVNALAPGLKTILFTSVLAETKTFVTLEAPKVAMSLGSLGTVFGVQFAAVFQSPLVGLRFQVALPAKLPSVSRANEINRMTLANLLFITLPPSLLSTLN